MSLITKYLTEELLNEVLKTYQWPVSFHLENELPDGINVAFPNCNLFFVEGLEGRVSVEFLPEDTQDQYMPFTIQDALEVLAPEVNTRGYDFFHLPGKHSLALVKEGTERCIALIHEHLLAVVKGDFSWVEEAKRRRTLPSNLESKG